MLSVPLSHAPFVPQGQEKAFLAFSSSSFLNPLLLTVLWSLGLQTWWSVDVRPLKQTALLVAFQLCAEVPTSADSVFLTSVC